ncbi:aminoacyl-tRNA hydrolase [Candidatus Peregrinibacteria bacterium]|nr:aminoacyl-tRNA hydrolase [Candidatus Peregrinibacteria bacterium]
MKIIVGLGNPGKEYEKTRHNAGAMCVDLLKEKLNLPQFKLQKKFKALISEGTQEKEKIILAKPQTFMNLSGESVQRLVKFYNCPLTNLVVVYDDVDLPLGKIRIRPNGSASTHNGMKSIVQNLDSADFPRLRIGVESRGVSAPEKQGLSSFVLNSFSKQEKIEIKNVLESAVDALILILQKGAPEAMQKYN